MMQPGFVNSSSMLITAKRPSVRVSPELPPSCAEARRADKLCKESLAQKRTNSDELLQDEESSHKSHEPFVSQECDGQRQQHEEQSSSDQCCSQL